MEEKFNWLFLGYAVILITLGQVGAYLQHNYQFLDKRFPPEWWGWYVCAIPITWFFLKGTYYGVNAFDGDLWPNRFIGFVIGIVSYSILTSYMFKQDITPKIFTQIVLCFVILMVQFLWKGK
jgi:hypothetical protein